MYKCVIPLLLGFLLNIITVDKSFAQSESVFEMSYFEDVNATHSFESVKQEAFKPVSSSFVNLGITQSTLWIKIKLDTKELQPETVLIINTPLKDRITLSYDLKDDTNITESLGIMYPHSKNEFNHYLPTFDIPIKNLKSPFIYIKVTSRWSMLVPITIKSKEAFYKERINSYFIGGLLIGGLLLMAIYNLFLFFSTRDFSYALYVLALISAILSQGYIFGILIPYLSPESPEFSFRFPLFIMACTGVFSAWFTIRFLDLKQTSKFLYFSLIFVVLLFLFNISLELLKIDYLSRKISIILIISSAFLIFSSALYSLIKGNKIALYFTIAWTFYLFGMIIFALKSVGVIPHNSFTEHFMHVGTFMEVVLLSFALGHKYHLVKVEKEKLEHQTRKDLEALVKKQTIKLETSLKEKEVLLKEVHHRVKNNLQIIISLLDLQVASVHSKKNREVLIQSKSRVYSMSLIHQKLYQSNNLAQINMKNYLEELFIYVQNNYSQITKKVNYISLIENKELSLNQAVPLGLIVNELLTNSFKYGLQKKRDNTIKMTLAFVAQNIILEVADSGTGFKEREHQQGVKKSLGLFLIKSLTKQLKGTVVRYYDKGLFITQLTIPVK